MDAPCKNRKKWNILLDLDETLISSLPTDGDTLPPHKSKKFLKHDMDGYYIVHERPGLQNFLDWLFLNFNVSVWTAATPLYAAEVIKNVILAGKNDRCIDWAFFSYHCNISKKMSSSKGTKDLSMLWKKYNIRGYTSENTVILDDYDHVHEIQKFNCVIATPFNAMKEQSEADDFLVKLRGLLDKHIVSSEASDVQTVVPMINEQLSPPPQK